MLPQSALADVVNAVSDAVVGMGPIEFLLKDPDVTEVMVSTWARHRSSDSCLTPRSSRTRTHRTLSAEASRVVGQHASAGPMGGSHPPRLGPAQIWRRRPTAGIRLGRVNRLFDQLDEACCVVREAAHVARLVELDRLRSSALGHEPLQLRIDGAVLARDRVPRWEILPGAERALAATAR